MASLHQSANRSARRAGRPANSRSIGIREQRIAGGFIKITTHQLAIGYWLYHAGHITFRQFRVWLAAFEMNERRRHMQAQEGDRKPRYRVEEILALTGGRGSPRASAELRSDVRALARIGLVSITEREISFATSIEQISLEDVSGFWSIYQQLPHRKRGIPIPRRTLRAMAAGFSRAVTAVMIALLIRSLFWQRGEDGQGDYRVDGRTKLAWIAEVFGVSRRAVTDARARLIELGWIEPVETSQWAMNRWGVHDRIVTDWRPANSDAIVEAANHIDSASPSPETHTESASPCLNRTLFLSEKTLNNRTPGAGPSDPAGVCGQTRLAGRGRRRRRTVRADRPRLQDIRPEHLRNTENLLELYDQAVEQRLVSGSEAGRVDFLALAERARARGHNPGGLFKWLLVNGRFDFITQADEDAASRRLHEWRDGPREEFAAIEDSQGRGGRPTHPRPDRQLCDDDQNVEKALRIGQHLKLDPFLVAREGCGWSRDRWEQARWDYQQRQREWWTSQGGIAGAA